MWNIYAKKQSNTGEQVYIINYKNSVKILFYNVPMLLACNIFIQKTLSKWVDIIIYFDFVVLDVG